MARPKQNQTQTAPRAEAAPKKITLDKFRAWLEGVEEMQADDWTPSPEQWQRIRSKIDDILEQAVQPRQRFIDEDDQPRGPIRPAGPSAFGPPAGGAPSGSMPAPTTALIVDSGAGGVTAPGVASTGTKMRTPNIDTSNAPYVAAFE